MLRFTGPCRRVLLVAALIASPLLSAPRPELLISTEQLAARLEDPNVLILHVGADRESFDGGHIPGAQFLPWSSVATTIDGVPNELADPALLHQELSAFGATGSFDIVLYDAARGLPSARAFVALESLRFHRVSVLDGQLAAWRAEDRPIERGAPRKRQAVESEMTAATDQVIGTDELRRALGAGQPQLVDSRSRAEYTGEKAGRDISPTRGGHLPGARHVFWEDHLVAGKVPHMRPLAELQALYADLDPKLPVITYCRTGVKASHSYFVLRYLGFEPRLYDGSFIVWHADPEAPVRPGEEP